jgi:protein tyrosine/serine phosphatase
MRIGIVLVVVVASAVSTWLGVETRRNRLVWDHFDVVKPDILYRSGQLNGKQLTAAVRRYGLKTIVNFQRPGTVVDEERALAKSLGVDFLNLPMTGDGFGQEAQFREVLKACDDPERRPVLVHCARGTCRTGASVALYRFERDGWTIADVSAEMKRQSYHDGWLPGYVFNMVKSRPGYPLPDPPIVLDDNTPSPPPPAATEPPRLPVLEY